MSASQFRLEWHPDIFGPMALADAQKIDGWRMPTRAELVDLFDSGSFPKEMHDKNFWSATPYAPYPTDAWYVYFSGGGTYADDTTNTNYVRLVRSGQSSPIFDHFAPGLGIVPAEKTFALRIELSYGGPSLYLVAMCSDSSYLGTHSLSTAFPFLESSVEAYRDQLLFLCGLDSTPVEISG